MLTLPPAVRIYVSLEPADLRKSIDGLCALVRAQGHDPLSGHLYLFASRRGDRIKILCWDRGGFVLYYKRLECGRFFLPRVSPGAREVELEAAELAMLLDGLDVCAVARPKRWGAAAQ